MKNLNFFIFFLFLTLNLTAQTPRQVLDLIPGTTSTFTDEDDRILGTVGANQILFQVYYTDARKEIWVSDGRQVGTQKLLDLGEAFLQSTLPYQKGQLLILYRNGQGEIWYSDGSKPGTRLLYSTPRSIAFPVLFKNVLYYASNNDTFLGNTDGLFALPLAGPTYEAKSIYSFETVYGISQLAALPDRLIGVGSVTGQGQQLFSSDGTTGGTKTYYQLNPGKPANLSDPIYATPLGNKLLFFYETNVNSLYATDGTAAGTKLLGQYKDQIFLKPYLEKRSFFSWEGKFYFSADTLSTAGASSETLNVSDGTPAGTRRITFKEGKFTKPEWFTPYKGKLYFKAYSEFDLEYVCVTEGTSESTKIAVDHFELGEGSSFGGDYLCVFQDSLFFSAWRREVGLELWRSNGQTSGTSKLDVLPGRPDSWPQQLTVAGEKLFFTALTSPAQGRELWVYDPKGTTTSTRTPEALPALVQLWPNPASTRLEVSAQAQVDLAQIRVYDLLGRPQYQTAVSGQSISTSIDLSTWPKGFYLLELRAQNGARKMEQFLLK